MGDRLGWKCTVRPVCKHTSNWLKPIGPFLNRVSLFKECYCASESRTARVSAKEIY